MPIKLTYKQLVAKHPEYAADYWAELRALYEGGARLLRDGALLDRLLPKHANERPDVYDERRKRAFYIAYAGQIVDQLVAGLGSDPLSMEAEGGKVDRAYYDRLFADVTLGRSKRKIPFAQFVADVVRDSLCFQKAWALVDLPKIDEGDDEPVDDALAEERLGLLDAYLCSLAPEQVFDYERDDEGDLAWAMVFSERRVRSSPTASRNVVRQEFLYMTRLDWARYVVEYDESKPPKEADEFEPEQWGAHSFGCVPLVRLDLPVGLWAMNKIASIAIEHFNKRNALSWGEYKSLFQFLRVTLQAPEGAAPLTEDERRGLNQPIGAGRVWVGAEKDQIGYVSPDPEPFRVALEDLKDLRDEMHRVVSAMAMASDNSGAALKRSGESKKLDKSHTAIVLEKLGEYVQSFAVELCETIAQGRGDRVRDRVSAKVQGVQWRAAGMTEYDDVDLSDLVDDAVKLATVPIPSPLFQTLHKTELARRVLGRRATPDDLVKIKAQLTTAFASDALAEGNKAKIDPKTGKPVEQPEPDDEDDVEDDKPEPDDKG